MSYFLFLLYLLVAIWVLRKSRFIRNSGLYPRSITGLFLLKILVCMGQGYYSIHLQPNSDSWHYFQESLPQYSLLIHHPLDYLRQMPATYASHVHALGALFDSSHSFWNYAGHQLMMKSMILLDILSGGRYYTNLLLFGLLVFFGHIALYRFFRENWNIPVTAVLAFTFFWPSLLFWSSSFDKEGILLVALGFLFLYLGRRLPGQARPGSLVSAMLCLVLVALLRDEMVLALLPAILAWALAARRKKRRVPFIFCGVYLLVFLIYVSLGHLSPRLDLPQKLVERRQQFQGLVGGSRLKMSPLKPDPLPIIKEAPAALDRVLLRPYPWEIRNLFYLLTWLDTLGVLIWLVASLVFFRGWKSFCQPALLSCLGFALPVLLLIGYVVPFLGAITRYKSLVLPFLLGASAAWTNWDKIARIRQKKPSSL